LLVALTLPLAWGCSSDGSDPEAPLPPGVDMPGGSTDTTNPGGGQLPPAGTGGTSSATPGMELGGNSEVTPDEIANPGAGGTSSGNGNGNGNGSVGSGAGGTGTETPPVVENPPEPVGDQFVEDNGLDCTVGELPNAIAANAFAPNPFQKLDGTIVASKADWRCRRKEIRAMAEQYVYGFKPGKPQSVTGNVTDAQVSANVTDQGRNANFTATIQLPTTGQRPFPAMFSVGGSDNNAFLSQGVAVITVNINGIAMERNSGGNQANRANKVGAFYTIYGNTSNTGNLAAWAWGVSRLIDVIEASDGSVIRKDAFAVMGCSRSGKAALAVGALDERIALTVPFESGTAGVPLYRQVAKAEVGDNGQPSQSLSSAFGEQAWFGDNFGNFLNSANTIPIDTHEILGMIAPRGLLVLDNPFIGELTPRGAHAAALAGVEVYKALGVQDSFGYLSNTGNGTHCSVRPEYQEPLRQAIQKHLFKNANATGGAITTSQTFATANPQDFINWATPTLQ
jgi:hypothetical protein